jgi:hypothetical protein
MKMWKKIILTMAVLAALSIAFLTWYNMHYSMDAVRSFEVNSPQLNQRILIATQGSRFKEDVVNGLIYRLRSRDVYIQVIDVTKLPEVEEVEWDGIVILHTWENWKPHQAASNFVARSIAPHKLIVLSTSRLGNNKLTDVDGLSSASLKHNVPELVNEITLRIEKLLNQPEP